MPARKHADVQHCLEYPAEASSQPEMRNCHTALSTTPFTGTASKILLFKSGAHLCTCMHKCTRAQQQTLTCACHSPPAPPFKIVPHMCTHVYTHTHTHIRCTHHWHSLQDSATHVYTCIHTYTHTHIHCTHHWHSLQDSATHVYTCIHTYTHTLHSPLAQPPRSAQRCAQRPHLIPPPAPSRPAPAADL